MLSAEKKVRLLEDDNRQLRREHSEMKKELDKMRKEVHYLKLLASSACLSGLHYDLLWQETELPTSFSNVLLFCQ